MIDRLENWLAERRGKPDAITTLRRIATGHSRAMWFAQMGDGERFVVRVEQGGVFGTSGTDEFAFMSAADQLGLPVARVRWNEPTGTVLGEPFFVMDFVDHLAVAREDRGLSDAVAEDFITQLDAVHRADWASQLSLAGSAEQATHDQIDRWANIYSASSGPVPLLDEAGAWLHRHAPVGERVGIVHADPGPGNFLHDGTKVVALTDWEFCHLGDPMEDWVYLIRMRGSRTMPQDAWRSLIKRVAGVVVTDADIRFWDAFNLFKGSCANLTCRTAFVGPNPVPNMAIIGTTLHHSFLKRLSDITGSPT